MRACPPPPPKLHCPRHPLLCPCQPVPGPCRPPCNAPVTAVHTPVCTSVVRDHRGPCHVPVAMCWRGATTCGRHCNITVLDCCQSNQVKSGLEQGFPEVLSAHAMPRGSDTTALWCLLIPCAVRELTYQQSHASIKGPIKVPPLNASRGASCSTTTRTVQQPATFVLRTALKGSGRPIRTAIQNG